MRCLATLVTLIALAASGAAAQQTVPVTVHDFIRAETDRYITDLAQRAPIGRFGHEREMVAVDRQTVIRMNRDTLYSSAVLDLDAGPATVTLPESAGRFMSLQAVDQDHFVYGVFYAPTTFVFTREQVGTRYLVLLARVFANPDDAADMDAARALQDRVTVSQAAPGRLDVPNWDRAQLDAMRGALNTLAAHTGRFGRAFGRRGEVNPIEHLIGTAAGWGGNPPNAAVYMSITPPADAGQTAYRMRLGEVPVDGFWSVTVYNADGFMQANDRNVYALNNVTARRGADGVTTLQFGGCAPATPNCIPTPAGWSAVMRLYLPRAAILDGSWRLPPLEPVR